MKLSDLAKPGEPCSQCGAEWKVWKNKRVKVRQHSENCAYHRAMLLRGEYRESYKGRELLVAGVPIQQEDTPGSEG